MKIYTVKGAAGINLHVREYGPIDRHSDSLHSRMVAKSSLLVEAV
jgi:hypothetical protein